MNQKAQWNLETYQHYTANRWKWSDIESYTMWYVNISYKAMRKMLLKGALIYKDRQHLSIWN